VRGKRNGQEEEGSVEKKNGWGRNRIDVMGGQEITGKVLDKQFPGAGERTL